MSARAKQTPRAAFLAELRTVLPGYRWTIRKASVSRPDGDYMWAEGRQSSGSNRLSSMEIERRKGAGEPSYHMKLYGHGTRGLLVAYHVGASLKLAVLTMEQELRRTRTDAEVRLYRAERNLGYLLVGRKPTAEAAS